MQSLIDVDCQLYDAEGYLYRNKTGLPHDKRNLTVFRSEEARKFQYRRFIDPFSWQEISEYFFSS